MTRSGTRRRGPAKGPSLWTLAAALVVIALAELGALHPDNPAVPRVRAAAVDWQATLDSKLALLAAGDLVAANRVDRAQVDPRFEELARLLRATGSAE